MKKIVLLGLLLFATQLASQTSSQSTTKPQVRAITAFVRLDSPNFQRQVADVLVVLRKVQSEFQARGYKVQNLRVTTQPLAELVSGMSEADALTFLKQVDDLSVKEKFLPNVGPGMLKDSDDPASMHLLERALSTLPNIEASAIIGDEAGIHWATIRRTAELVKYVSEHSPRSQGNFNFTATAMLQPLGPFYPGSYHTGAGNQFAIGFEGANVVQDVFAEDKGNVDKAITDLTVALSKHASVANAIGQKIASETGWVYVGLDPTPAPGGDISIAAAIESFTGAKFGSSGTLTAARIVTTAVKAVSGKQVGYSGLMVPVLEDKLLAQRWAASNYNVDSLLAYSTVCGTGLDTVPFPGDISTQQIERILTDLASVAVKWNKPLSARLLPVHGKKAGDQTDFDSPYLFNTMLHPLP